MLGNNRIYAEFTLIFTLRAICPDQKLFAESSSSRQTGVTSRDAVFGVVVRYPLFAAEISRLDAQKIILVAVWRHAKILVSADSIVFGCNAISRKNQARCEPKRRPSQTEPMRKLVLTRIVRLQRAYQALRAVSNRYIWVSLAILAVKPMPQLLVAVFLIVRETISVLRSRSLQSLTQTLLRIEIAAPKFNQNTPASS